MTTTDTNNHSFMLSKDISLLFHFYLNSHTRLDNSIRCFITYHFYFSFLFQISLFFFFTIHSFWYMCAISAAPFWKKAHNNYYFCYEIFISGRDMERGGIKNTNGKIKGLIFSASARGTLLNVSVTQFLLTEFSLHFASFVLFFHVFTCFLSRCARFFFEE